MNEKPISSRKALKVPVLLFLLAGLLIVLSAVGGVSAALTVNSDNYVGTFEVKNIDIELRENGEVRNTRDSLLKHFPAESDKFAFGYWYKEELTARNIGTIDQYVRVVVHRYWEDKAGKKVTTLDPRLIELEFGKDWFTTGESESGETFVMYYPKLVTPGSSTTPFVTRIRVSDEVLDAVSHTVTEIITENGKETTYIYTYDYHGTRFRLEAEADAVQTHNAVDAIKAAWGVDVTMDGTDILAVEGAHR